MTILTLYYRNYGGGYFRRLCRLIKACEAAGHTVYYMAPGRFPGMDNASRIVWLRAPLPGPPILKALTALLFWPFWVLLVTVRYRIDRFAVFGFPYATICGLSSKLTGKPLITFVRSDWIAELELAGRDTLTRAASRVIFCIGAWVSEVIVANSASLGSTISKRLGETRVLRVLPNDIDWEDSLDRRVARTKLAKTCGYPENCFVLGYVGTFKPRKQVCQVVDVFHSVRETQSVLVLVGDGSDRERVISRISELGLQGRVYWLGWQDEVRELLAGMDLTIIPSRFEGSPNAVLESIGVGTPVIGTDVMGISDILPAEMLFPLDDVQKAGEMVREGTIRGQFYSDMVRLIQEVRQRLTFDWDTLVVRTIVSA